MRMEVEGEAVGQVKQGGIGKGKGGVRNVRLMAWRREKGV